MCESFFHAIKQSIIFVLVNTAQGQYTQSLLRKTLFN